MLALTPLTGVFGPILLEAYLPAKMSTVFTVLKQFGTGVIISTAFVHVSLPTSTLRSPQ